MENKRVALIGGGVAVVVAIAAAVVWFGPFGGSEAELGLEPGDTAYVAAEEFSTAWVEGDLASVPATAASGNIAEQSLITTADLGPGGVAPSAVAVTGLAVVNPDDPDDDGPTRVSADLKVTWAVPGDHDWTYDTSVELVEQESDGADQVWAVDWTPSVVHPRLVPGDRFATVSLPTSRGQVLGPDGQPLVGGSETVEVGIEPRRSSDPAATAREVAGLVGVDADELVARVEAAAPDAFVSVITLPRADYDAQRDVLQPLPGTVFRTESSESGTPKNFARALLGSTGSASEEAAEGSGGSIQVGDVIGVSGLQAAQNETLTGQPGISIRAASNDPAVETRELEEFPSVPGESVQVTIDTRLQIAADEVMAGAPGPAALVAIRVSTGDVLAVSNGPTGFDGYNRAMVGTYPPGSTFKIASGLTLLENGLTPDTIVGCPATIVVGKEFRNFGGSSLGDVPFRQDFINSCNTAFVSQSREITSEQLSATAGSLGYRDLDIGVPLVGGSVPITESVTEHAANMLGQGKVTASPFVVALASASVGAGRTLEPRLIVDPDNPQPAPGAELPPGPIADLRSLMRGVVTNGTGTALANVAGGEVFGKTGTAEFGTESPPETHAWFTGYQGDVAFAVLVEGGSAGGAVAAPLAAQFLTKIAQ